MLDKIGTPQKVAAIRDIGQRGVAIVATVHGTTLLANPGLNPLVGGKQRAIIGDTAAEK